MQMCAVKLPMARRIHVSFQLLVYMTTIFMENPSARVKAYEIVFSDDVTTDFTTGGIDVPSLMRTDWLSLPLVGICGLAAKYNIPHKVDTTLIHGTFHTTFEYLTQDCTAEYSRDMEMCPLVNANFAPCLVFPIDSRASRRPWGYCTNNNFRVSYLWIPSTKSNATSTPMTFSDLNMTMRALRSGGYLQGSLSDWETPPVCSGYGCGGNFRESSNPAALASIYKDVPALKRLVTKGSRISSSAATSSKSCDWRFSNLIPVAWDGLQNVLAAGQSLQSNDTKFALTMQRDCNLVLYKKRDDGKIEWNAKWATFSQFNDPFQYNCSLELQPNGNLVVRDPAGNPRWNSGGTTSSLYTSALSLLSCGNVIVIDLTSGSILWATHTGHV